jgi:hypothetical protein
MYVVGPKQTTLGRFFKTRKDATLDIQKVKRQKTEQEKTEEEEEAEYNEYRKRQADRLNETYRTLRFFIHEDGTIENYVEKWCDYDTRLQRIMFLEEEHVTHNEDVQKFVDEVLSRRS